MTCTACARRVEKDLNKVEGVSAYVDFASEKAHVTAGDEVTQDQLRQAVEDAGYKDVTPSAFSEAVEEDRDIPPTVLKAATDILKSGQVEMICVTVNTETAQIKALENLKVSEARFSELLNQHEDTYEITGDYFDMLDSAIGMLGYHD